jgi:hypothetical protein
VSEEDRAAASPAQPVASSPETPAPTTPAQALSAFSRRNLLRGGLGGAVLLALGGVGLGLQSTRRGAAPAEALSVLTLDEHAILSAVAARVCPQPGPDVPGADAIGVGLLADQTLLRAGPETTADVKAVLALFENGLTGALFLERVRPFTQLDPAAQDAVLLAWRDSSVALRRTVYRALSSLTTAIYFGDARVWPGVGYPGPPDPAALRRAYAAQLVDLAALRAPGAEDT